jgi:hypothetical protein
MVLQICEHGSDYTLVVVQPTQSNIAAIAQKATNGTRGVVVINYESTSSATNRTHAALPVKHSFVLILGYAVTPLDDDPAVVVRLMVPLAAGFFRTPPAIVLQTIFALGMLVEFRCRKSLLAARAFLGFKTTHAAV